MSLMDWLFGGSEHSSNPPEVVERDQPLYETMGQVIERVVVDPERRTITLWLVNKWHVVYTLDDLGNVLSEERIEPDMDMSPAALKSMCDRLEK
jgi:hypothetical protein